MTKKVKPKKANRILDKSKGGATYSLRGSRSFAGRPSKGIVGLKKG